MAQSIMRTYLDPNAPPRSQRLPAVSFETLSGEEAFRNVREREIVRVLDKDGALVSSPFVWRIRPAAQRSRLADGAGRKDLVGDRHVGMSTC